MTAERLVNAAGRAVEACQICGRWTFAGFSCCVPCENGRGKYPHEWLCDTNEKSRMYYPVNLDEGVSDELPQLRKR